MRKIAINLVVALVAFSVGMASWMLNPLGTRVSQWHEPLMITVKANRDYKLPAYSSGSVYTVIVRNISDKTIRGYSLGMTCNCKAWDSDGNLYPPNTNFSNPNPDRQVLQPGQSREETIIDFDSVPPRVWPDLVHFADGTNWGPNRGHKEGYVRE